MKEGKENPGQQEQEGTLWTESYSLPYLLPAQNRSTVSHARYATPTDSVATVAKSDSVFALKNTVNSVEFAQQRACDRFSAHYFFSRTESLFAKTEQH